MRPRYGPGGNRGHRITGFAAITRRALLAHRDGAKVFSGTYLTDASVLEAREDRFARMVK